jgi:hypothetical protein
MGHDRANRWDVHRALATTSAVVTRRVGLPLVAGGVFQWPVALPQDLLPYCYSECGGFRSIVTEALAKHPCTLRSPWRLILYCDEITPGNPLRPDNKRKMTAFYISWVELGPFLRSEEAWLTVGVLRPSLVKQVVGGFSGAVRCLMRALLLGADSLRTAGAMLGESLFFCKYHRMIMDEAAGKAVWSVKGASGLKPCIDCKNVVALGSVENPGLASFDADGYVVDITCPDDSQFDAMGDGDLATAYDQLAALKASAGITKANFDKAERAYGISFNPACLLADVGLRPLVNPSSYTRDPMHVMLSGGVANTEIFLVLKAIASCMAGFKYSTMKEFCSAAWGWPCTRNTAIGEVFSEVRESSSKEAEMFKAGASETLSVYPLVRHFLEKFVPAHLIAKERLSFLALCDVLDSMQACKAAFDVEQIYSMKMGVRRFLRLHIDAHGVKYIRPKHHYMFHMFRQPMEDLIWLDCFVHERKHQLTKGLADVIKNTRDFESSVLTAVLNATVENLRDVFASGLLPPTAASHELTVALGVPCQVSHRMKYNFSTYGSGDVLLCGTGAFVVEACVDVGGTMVALARRLILMEQTSPTTSRWRVAEQNLVEMHSTLCSVHCWHTTSAGDLVVLTAKIATSTCAADHPLACSGSSASRRLPPGYLVRRHRHRPTKLSKLSQVLQLSKRRLISKV